LTRRIGCEVTDLSTIVELVRAGLGIALVPADADVSSSGLCLIPLADESALSLTVDFVMPSGTAASPAALAFAERLTVSQPMQVALA
jgi:DNA-binding transcriptional LysR family regulator